MIRLFVAIELPGELKERLGGMGGGVPGAKWVGPENLHLTLRFIGEVDGARVTVQIVEVTGTYDGGMTMTDAPAERQPGWMLLGGIAHGPDAPWFFKFTGPEKTIRDQRDAFLGMMRSLQPAG